MGSQCPKEPIDAVIDIITAGSHSMARYGLVETLMGCDKPTDGTLSYLN